MPYDPDTHGPRRIVGPGFHERVYEAVGRVPAGSVTTYGDVGAVLGSARVARHVGNALAALHEKHGDVPWFRVINARGAISSRGVPLAEEIQRQLLLREGIRFSEGGRVDLERYRWNGRAARRGKKQPGTAGWRPRASSRGLAERS